MVTDEQLKPKKAKRKKKDDGDGKVTMKTKKKKLDEMGNNSVLSKKKKKKSLDGSILKKKKKKKKLHNNSSMLQSTQLLDATERLSDGEGEVMFGSQSPSPIKSVTSPPPLTKYRSAVNDTPPNKEEVADSSDDVPSSSDVETVLPVKTKASSPAKRPVKEPVKKIKKVAKKTKIVPVKVAQDLSQVEEAETSDEDPSESEEEEEVEPAKPAKKAVAVPSKKPGTPVKKKAAPKTTPPKEAPKDEGTSDEDLFGDSPREEIVLSPPKKVVAKPPTPIKKSGTSVKPKVEKPPKSPAKPKAPLEHKVIVLNTEGGEEEEEDDDMMDELVEEEGPGIAPLSDVLMSRKEQENRDYLLLIQIKNKFPTQDPAEINWNEIVVYDMTPEEMIERYEILLKYVKRTKSNSDLVSEAVMAIGTARVRTLLQQAQRRERLAAPVKEPVKDSIARNKRLNAFTVFASSFTNVPAEAIKVKWEELDSKQKSKYRREAKALNNAHGFFPAKKKPTAYNVFCSEQMKLGRKMGDIGRDWKEMSEEEKQVFKDRAVKEGAEQGEVGVEEVNGVEGS